MVKDDILSAESFVDNRIAYMKPYRVAFSRYGAFTVDTRSHIAANPSIRVDSE